MEPVTTAAITAVKKESVQTLEKEAKGIIRAILGEPARALGGLLGDKVNKKRHANLIKIVVDAKRKLAEAGVSPKEVPLKIIHPMLETASLEENEDLQDVWANLVANAADPRKPGVVGTSFAVMLKELGIREVRFLDKLYGNSVGILEVRHTRSLIRTVQDIRYTWFELLKIYFMAGLTRSSEWEEITARDLSMPYFSKNKQDLDTDMSDFEFTLGILRRQNILQEDPFIPAQQLPFLFDRADFPIMRHYVFSEVGLRLINACRPPTRSPSGS
jgi:Abortive infection alpha